MSGIEALLMRPGSLAMVLALWCAVAAAVSPGCGLAGGAAAAWLVLVLAGGTVGPAPGGCLGWVGALAGVAAAAPLWHIDSFHVVALVNVGSLSGLLWASPRKPLGTFLLAWLFALALAAVHAPDPCYAGPRFGPIPDYYGSIFRGTALASTVLLALALTRVPRRGGS